jgi:outer membrane lipoprotein LolB
MPARNALSLAWVLMLAACAGPVQRPTEPADWTAHSAQLARLADWTASGKLALRTEERSDSANIVWRQRDRNSHLNLSGPMGVNATEVRSDGERIEITQGEERRSFDISSPEAIRRNTGWELPLQSLPYWLKGLPSPHLDVQSLQLDPQRGLLRDLRQDNWQIHYQEYDDFGQYTLPTRLRIERGATAVRILLREWQAGTS